MPVRTDGRLIGVLCLEHVGRPRVWSADEIDFAAAAADQVAVMAAARDRRAAEAALRDSERRFATVFRAGPDGITISRVADSTYLEVNDVFCQMTGYGRDEVVGRHALDLRLYATPTAARAELVGHLRAGRPVRDYETPTRRRDGTVFDASVSVEIIEVDGVECLLAITRDISVRKRHERALQELNERLEERVAWRTRELAAEKERAESADRLKSAFLATMSHELRTPLNSIIGFTGILLQGLVGPLSAEQAKQLGMVQTSARHLLSLISDVLDISKIEAGQLELDCRPFDVPAAVGKVAQMLKPLADRKGLAVAVELEDGAGEVVGDRRRFEQVLINLANNAVKFTDRGGVAVTAGTSGGRLAVAVADTGIGVRPADLARLFQPFVQVDSGLARSHDGTGAGPGHLRPAGPADGRGHCGGE